VKVPAHYTLEQIEAIQMFFHKILKPQGAHVVVDPTPTKYLVLKAMQNTDQAQAAG
jgi:hypothetical protein